MYSTAKSLYYKSSSFGNHIFGSLVCVTSDVHILPSVKSDKNQSAQSRIGLEF